MQLGGVSTSSESIVGSLQASSYFTDVTLTGVRNTDPSRMGVGTQFDLSMVLRSPAMPGMSGEAKP